MRPVPAITERVQKRIEDRVCIAASEVREADVQADKSQRRAESARDAAAKKRLALGKLLVEARAEWPRSGPNAKGWGELLKRAGLDEATAWRYMKLAEPEFSFTDGDDVKENPRTYADIGLDKRPRKALREDQPDPAEADQGAVEIISPGAAIDIRLGDWRSVFTDIGIVDALIVDPPYGSQTHEAVTTRDDGCIPTGLTPTYDAWTPLDVEMFVAEWAPRCRGWMVALTSDDLIPAWRSSYRAHDRYDFAPVPCVIRGMSVRIQGDGPSSWAVYAMVSRPRNLAKWGTLPGAYEGPAQPGAKSGRGKPDWLMDALVRDFSRAGDLVCDPLAGFGTTLRSALRLGRRAVGAEIDPDARREAIVRWRQDQNGRARPASVARPGLASSPTVWARPAAAPAGPFCAVIGAGDSAQTACRNGWGVSGDDEIRWRVDAEQRCPGCVLELSGGGASG